MMVVGTLKKINLGCGSTPKEGYINVDIIDFNWVDIVHDLNEFPYPFEDDSIDEINMDSIFEHLKDPIKVVEELWRICKDRSKIHIKTSHYASQNAWDDMDHKKTFGAMSFKHWDVERGAPGLLVRDNDVKFEVNFNFLMPLPLRMIGIKYIANNFSQLYEKYMCYIFQPGAIEFDLVAVK